MGVLDLRRRTIPDGSGTAVTEILIDGHMLMSSLCTVSERALTTHALAMHPEGDDLSILVGGLGLGYTAFEALQDPRVGKVRIVDRSPDVIRWVREGMVPLSPDMNDPRVEIVEGDVYADLFAPGDGAWDLVIIDVDHCPSLPIDPSSAPFYTWQGQRQVMDHLRPDGVLAVWSSEDDYEFIDVLQEVWPEARRELVLWTNPQIDAGEEIEEAVFLARNSVQLAEPGA